MKCFVKPVIYPNWWKSMSLEGLETVIREKEDDCGEEPEPGTSWVLDTKDITHLRAWTRLPPGMGKVPSSFRHLFDITRLTRERFEECRAGSERLSHGGKIQFSGKGSLGGQRGRGLGEVSWIQEEVRDRAAPGQEGPPRSAKHQDGERRVQSQEDPEASRKASDGSEWEGATRDLWGIVEMDTALPLSSSLPVLLLSPHLFVWNMGLLVLPGRQRYLVSSAPSSASTWHKQKWRPLPRHVPTTAHPQSFPKLLKKKEKRPVWTWCLQCRGKTRGGPKRERQVLEKLFSQL